MLGHGFVASFIGHEPGKALFVGLYSIDASKPLTYKQYWRVPEYVEMKPFGLEGWSDGRKPRCISTVCTTPLTRTICTQQPGSRS